MLRLMGVMLICLMTFPAFCQSTSKNYQLATIVDVKPHQAAGKGTSAVSFRRQLRVNGTGKLLLSLSNWLHCTELRRVTGLRNGMKRWQRC